MWSTMNGTSWTMSNNYFTSPTGKVVTQWPFTNTSYRVLTKALGRVSETTRRLVAGVLVPDTPLVTRATEHAVLTATIAVVIDCEAVLLRAYANGYAGMFNRCE